MVQCNGPMRLHQVTLHIFAYIKEKKKILMSVLSRPWSVDFLSMGTGSAQSSFLNCFPLHLGRVDPVSVNYPWLSLAST